MVLNSWQFSPQLRTNCESTLYELRTKFEPTSNELRLNFKRTSAQLQTNFASTSNELRPNLERTSSQLRTNFESTSFEVHEVRTSHGNIIFAAAVCSSIMLSGQGLGLMLADNWGKMMWDVAEYCKSLSHASTTLAIISWMLEYDLATQSLHSLGYATLYQPIPSDVFACCLPRL